MTEGPFAVKEGFVSGIAFSPDGTTLATGYGIVSGKVGGVAMWDVAGRKRLTEKTSSVKGGSVSSVAFSPDGTTLAAGYGAREVRLGGGVVLWDRTDRKRVTENSLPVKEGEVQSVAFSPDGTTLAAGFSRVGDGRLGSGVVLWDVAGRKRLTETRSS